jgi:hypothetical protein
MQGSKNRDMQSFPLVRALECRLSLLACFHACSWSVLDYISRFLAIHFRFAIRHFYVTGRHGPTGLTAVCHRPV